MKPIYEVKATMYNSEDIANDIKQKFTTKKEAREYLAETLADYSDTPLAISLIGHYNGIEICRETEFTLARKEYLNEIENAF